MITQAYTRGEPFSLDLTTAVCRFYVLQLIRGFAAVVLTSYYLADSSSRLIRKEDDRTWMDASRTI